MPPSERPFMGATPYSDETGSGVTFRVWAPFAAQVSVAGEFNHWSQIADPLFSEGNGYWSVDVPGGRLTAELISSEAPKLPVTGFPKDVAGLTMGDCSPLRGNPIVPGRPTHSRRIVGK